MKPIKLNRTSPYKRRIDHYASDLTKRYRVEIGEVFVRDVGKAEEAISLNADLGVKAPYLLRNKQVILREWYFDSGPAPYCIIYSVKKDMATLITLWHGVGSRASKSLFRIWNPPKSQR
jgi:hypothetical protein